MASSLEQKVEADKAAHATLDMPSKEISKVSLASAKSNTSQGSRDGRWRDPSCVGNPLFTVEWFVSLLFAWALFAGLFVALYYIALAVRGTNYMQLRTQEWGPFTTTTLPSAYGSVPAPGWGGSAANVPQNCPVSGSGVVCGASATAGALSMFPWVADKLAVAPSPVPGCVEAGPELGFAFNPTPRLQCINGVPAATIAALKAAKP